MGSSEPAGVHPDGEGDLSCIMVSKADPGQGGDGKVLAFAAGRRRERRSLAAARCRVPLTVYGAVVRVPCGSAQEKGYPVVPASTALSAEGVVEGWNAL